MSGSISFLLIHTHGLSLIFRQDDWPIFLQMNVNHTKHFSRELHCRYFHKSTILHYLQLISNTSDCSCKRFFSSKHFRVYIRFIICRCMYMNSNVYASRVNMARILFVIKIKKT